MRTMLHYHYYPGSCLWPGTLDWYSFSMEPPLSVVFRINVEHNMHVQYIVQCIRISNNIGYYKWCVLSSESCTLQIRIGNYNKCTQTLDLISKYWMEENIGHNFIKCHWEFCCIVFGADQLAPPKATTMHCKLWSEYGYFYGEGGWDGSALSHKQINEDNSVCHFIIRINRW